MIFSLNVSVTLSADDKQWLEAHAVDPVVAAINNVAEAIIDQHEALKAFAALKAQFDAVDKKSTP